MAELPLDRQWKAEAEAEAEQNAMQPHCAVHPDTQLVCPSCLGAIGGKATSKAKIRAVRKNGLLGGRPKNLRGGRPKKNLPPS